MRLSIALTALLVLFGLTYVHSIAVMSVDLGSEWMKVGIVSPGVPMEIALNKESKRKSPAIISFRDNIRLFGEDAQTLGIRFPKNAYSYVLDLLGKEIDHPMVKLFQKRFPYYEITSTDRGTIQFKHDENTFYTPEEIVAQFLLKAKEFAENGAHQPVKECVITVPGFFNQVERKALLQAAELAGLKVLQLINDYTAVAMNYGIFRRKIFNETAQYVIFYDMGASSTTATLVSYQTIKTKERGYLETHPQVSILGVGFDRTLGGLEMQLRLRDYLGKKFNEMKKTKNDVFKNPRSLAKLFKEAGRLKNVLSANTEHYAQVEGLLDEQDFKILVTREEFEELIKDLLERVGKPIEQALKTAHLVQDVVSQVVLVGAGTRVPKVQEILQKVVKQDLAKNINTDEAAAMGAVYKAADLSTGFKVQKFITKDAVIYPVQVNFEREVNGSMKQVKRTLFGLMNPYPQKKIITFNKHTKDFTFNVNYGDLDYLPEEDIVNLGNQNISVVSVVGVEEAIAKHTGKNVESKGIKAHFAMDESGILSLATVEYVVEKLQTEEEEEGTLSKLGSTFSKLFGGDEEKPEGQAEEKPKAEGETAEEEKKEKEPEKEEKEAPANETDTKNDTATNTTQKETKEVKPKVVTVKEPIKATENVLTINVMDKKQLEESMEKLQALAKIEREINRRATALNNLESFVIDVQNKLYEDEYTQSSTPEEVEKIKTSCSAVSDWLYEDGSEADADTYEKKLEELKSLTRDLFSRVWEHRERPDALNALHSMLNQSTHFLNTAKNLTKTTNTEKDVFTDEEVAVLEKLIVDTTEWRDKMVKEQEKLKNYEPVKLTIKLLTDKMQALDREVKYLVNKIKLWRPKKVEKPVKEEEEKQKTSDDTEKVNKDETKAEETIETPEKGTTEDESIEPTTTTEGGQEDSHTEL